MLDSVKQAFRAERERTVPAQFGILHYLGTLTLIFFLLEVVTGILLLVYYRPSAGAAYYSTGIIMDDARLGWLIRGVHRWGSDLVILLLLLHIARVYFSRAYQVPRHVNWAVGIILLVLVLGLGFTGTLLPWDQYAYWYTESARQTISGIPLVGNFLLGLFWGGWDIGEEVLLRFYAFHVGVLPWLALSFLSLHFLLVWRFGIKAPPASRQTGPPLPFFPDFLVNVLIAVLLIGGVLLTAAVVFPPLLTARADPLVPLQHTQPRWYLLAVRELLRDLPHWTAALSVIAFFGVLFLVPALDRRPTQSTAGKILQRGFGLAVIVAWALLSIRAYLR